MTSLTLKQKAFVDEYVVCRNGAEAARRARYGVLSARVTASRLLTKANIKAALAIKEAVLARKVNINKVTIVNEVLASITMAKTKHDASTMIRGWVEIAKMLDMYKPEKIEVKVRAESKAIRAKYEAMSDEELMAIVNG